MENIQEMFMKLSPSVSCTNESTSFTQKSCTDVGKFVI